MSQRALTVALAASLGLFCSAHAFAYTAVYSFGDSLSDAGNLYNLTGGGDPQSPYSNGRLESNGAVWVQDLAVELGLPAVQASLSGVRTTPMAARKPARRSFTLLRRPPRLSTCLRRSHSSKRNIRPRRRAHCTRWISAQTISSRSSVPDCRPQIRKRPLVRPLPIRSTLLGPCLAWGRLASSFTKFRTWA